MNEYGNIEETNMKCPRLNGLFQNCYFILQDLYREKYILTTLGFGNAITTGYLEYDTSITYGYISLRLPLVDSETRRKFRKRLKFILNNYSFAFIGIEEHPNTNNFHILDEYIQKEFTYKFKTQKYAHLENKYLLCKITMND